MLQLLQVMRLHGARRSCMAVWMAKEPVCGSCEVAVRSPSRVFVWQAKDARKEREAQVAKAQMEAALHSGVSWGMAGDNQVCRRPCAESHARTPGDNQSALLCWALSCSRARVAKGRVVASAFPDAGSTEAWSLLPSLQVSNVSCMQACLLLLQDPEDEGEAAALAVDWRAYSQTHTLTDKQARLAEKIRKRENRIGALQKEVDKIRVGSRLDMEAIVLERFPSPRSGTLELHSMSTGPLVPCIDT